MKKRGVCLLLAALTAFLCAPAGAAAGRQGEAGQIELEVRGPAGMALQRLTDGSVGSKCSFSDKGTVEVRSSEGFAGLYLIFDRPALWTLVHQDGSGEARGQDGFLHEYLPLERPEYRVELVLPEGAVLCEVQAFGQGTLPARVQVWQPPCERADLLVLPTHADDEHLWFGGALPYYAGEKGYDVQVAYMTNHWGEPCRPHELLDGLWTVGVRHYPVVSEFADLYASKESLEAARGVYDEQAVTAWQVEQLRRFEPLVVLGHDVNGEYGHGAHRLNAATLLKALEMSGDPAVFPQSAALYGTWQVQKCYLHLWPENTVQMEWGEMPLEAFGGKTALEMAAEGFACHASQTQWFQVKAGGRNDCRKFGLAFTAVGPDGAKNDFFEHTDRGSER